MAQPWAIAITGVLMSAIYVVSMIALVRLVQHSAVTPWKIDPVCGMKVDPKTALQYVYQRQTYYFCALACQQSFTETPEAYLTK
jgi:YHS domain-containing protein